VSRLADPAVDVAAARKPLEWVEEVLAAGDAHVVAVDELAA